VEDRSLEGALSASPRSAAAALTYSRTLSPIAQPTRAFVIDRIRDTFIYVEATVWLQELRRRENPSDEAITRGTQRDSAIEKEK
jgi:hypothetical protein